MPLYQKKLETFFTKIQKHTEETTWFPCRKRGRFLRESTPTIHAGIPSSAQLTTIRDWPKCRSRGSFYNICIHFYVKLKLTIKDPKSLPQVLSFRAWNTEPRKKELEDLLPIFWFPLICCNHNVLFNYTLCRSLVIDPRRHFRYFSVTATLHTIFTISPLVHVL
jgi:hypothetical protein